MTEPVRNTDELASTPLREWLIEVFQHLCHSPHTPDSWKRDLDKKTQVLLDALDAEVAKANAEREEAVDALERIANRDYRGNQSEECQIARHALIAMRKEGTT